MAAVFQKQLRLSSEGRRRHSAGEITNYIAVDAYRLGEFPFWLHLAWSMPVQLALAIALLFWTVGAGALPGLAPVAVCGVLNVPFAEMPQRYQSRFMQAQDERQRATAEMLNSTKVVKLQSWEEQFRATVQRLRDVEKCRSLAARAMLVFPAVYCLRCDVLLPGGMLLFTSRGVKCWGVVLLDKR